MQLSNVLNVSLLQEHINNRVISERVFKDTPLRILNYTQVAQYDNIWDDVTKQCRGLIYDSSTGEVIARPFPKFWNYSDERFPETLPENLPAGMPVLAKKYDGSLGIIFTWQGQYHVSTRGSFHSEQAEWATQWLRQNKPHFYIPEGCTPLVEIIYPGNRIVVDYQGEENLVLLTLVFNETGGEEVLREISRYAIQSGLDLFEFRIAPINVCLNEDLENEEGYVALWLDEDKPPFRVKIKYEGYKRLHKLLTQCSQKTIWEMLVAGQEPMEAIKETPVEFQGWVAEIKSDLWNRFNEIAFAADRLHSAAPQTSRKDYALYVKEKPELMAVCFAMLDGKRVDPVIWKMLKPSGLKVFKVDEEG